MSDQPPPPKPKPGSLRDRIAAFEKPAATSGSAPPPPRPKPGNLSKWTPKPASPPSSPGNVEHKEEEKEKRSGMSVSDAKESIGMGGSLKERMAALQGRGGFGGGGGTTSPPPKPATEKPKWKPPPKVVSPPPDGDEESIAAAAPPGDDEAVKSPPLAPVPAQSPPAAELSKQAEKSETGGEEGGDENDPEEEERQRRAAIAARMARLGGARLGMGPPVFAPKPTVKKPEAPKDVTLLPAATASPSSEVTPAERPGRSPVVEDVPKVTSPPAEATNAASPKPPSDYFTGTESPPPRKSSDASSLLSPEQATPQPSRSPGAMPVPAGPRRAAPPRKKAAAKSPSPAPTPVFGETTEIRESPLQAPPPPEGEDKLEAAEAIGRKPEDEETAEERLVTTGGDAQAAAENEEKRVLGDMEPEVHESDMDLNKTKVGAAAAAQDALERAVEEVGGAQHGALTEDDEESKSASERDPSIIVQDKVDDTPPIKSPDIVPAHESVPREEVEEVVTSQHVEPANIDTVEVPETTHETNCKPPIADEDEDEDEETRRKRVAERVAKMGGFNPFAGPPPPGRRQSSTRSYESTEEPVSAPVERRSSLRKSSADSGLGTPPPVPRSARPSVSGASVTSQERKTSVGSVMAEELAAEEVEEDAAVPTDWLHEEPAAIPEEVEPAGDSAGEDAHDRKPVGEAPDEVQDELSEAPSDARARDGPDQPESEDNEVEDPSPPPPPARQPMPPPPVPQASRPSVVASEDERPPIPSPSARRSLPPPPRAAPIHSEEVKDEPEPEIASPPPPVPPTRPFSSNGSSESEPSVVSPHRAVPPPPPFPQAALEMDEEEEVNDECPDEDEPPPPPARRSQAPSPQSRPAETTSVAHRPSVPIIERSPVETEPDREILDEEEGDPIDPGFISPARSPRSPDVNLPAVSPPAEDPAAEATAGEDEEQARRKTIAERMAKLGGIRFGAPPPIGRPPPREHHTEEEEQLGEPSAEAEHAPSELTEEEEEAARKQRIAAKLASMGGRGFGMMAPGMGGPPPPPSRPKVERQASDDTVSSPPPPPARAPPPHMRPPPPPPAQDPESEIESITTSEDGVKVEAEESELEEVSHEDAEPEAPPPPVPSRTGRRSSGVPPLPIASPRLLEGSPARSIPPPPLSAGRPPIPATPSNVSRRTSTQESRRLSSDVPPRHVPPAHAQSDFVMVEDPEELEDEPPPPPPRSARPPRGAPLPPPPPESKDSQLELPSAPSDTIDFGTTGPDLSLSTFSEDSTSYPSSNAKPLEPAAHPPRSAESLQHLSSDDLMAVWGKVGVHVYDAATAAFEKSKKTLVGDGSYAGFVHTVLGQVPSARLPVPPSYGYLVYTQSASAVQTRASEIMPGDVVTLVNAKLKGHKGLQTYHQSVGEGEPLVGIVSEFEPKKSKVKVFQANQHVGQQTVESVSYRLEDLKSGSIKIFRVLEA